MLRLISTFVLTVGYFALGVLLLLGTLAAVFGQQSGTVLVLMMFGLVVGVPAVALIVLGHLGRALTTTKGKSAGAAEQP